MSKKQTLEKLANNPNFIKRTERLLYELACEVNPHCFGEKSTADGREIWQKRTKRFIRRQILHMVD